MRLNGQAAIVTGGGSGLGAATARRLASAGCRVTVLDINQPMVEASAQSIGGIGIVCDVADAASAEGAVVKARETHGPARLLVNCAGVGTAGRIVGRDGPMPLAAFERVIRINLIGSFNLLRLAAADMAKLDPLDEGERGVIINTASVAAFDGQIGQAAYSASKGGVVGMTLPIARDLSSLGIRVCTIAPGLFLTPMMMGLSPEAQKSLGMQVPFPPRLGDPKEYAQLAMSIVANHMLNGETIRLDGAIRMAPK